MLKNLNRRSVINILKSPKCNLQQYRFYASSEHVFEVTDVDQFDRDVLKASQTVPVLVDMYADWCGPCRLLTPVLTNVVNSKNGAIKLAKVNVDDNGEIAEKYKVSSIPAVFLIKNGKVVDQFVGALPKEKIESFIAAHQTKQ
jgi:thioredoxin